MYGVTLMLMVCLASGLLFGSTPKGAMATLCFCFLLGLGIGGDYLLSATIMFMSEYANKWSSGRVAPSSRPISPYRASATSPVASSPFMFSTVSRCYSPRDGQTVHPVRFRPSEARPVLGPVRQARLENRARPSKPVGSIFCLSLARSRLIGPSRSV